MATTGQLKVQVSVILEFEHRRLHSLVVFCRDTGHFIVVALQSMFFVLNGFQEGCLLLLLECPTTTTTAGRRRRIGLLAPSFFSHALDIIQGFRIGPLFLSVGGAFCVAASCGW